MNNDVIRGVMNTYRVKYTAIYIISCEKKQKK